MKHKTITANDNISDLQLMGFFEGDGCLEFPISCSTPGKVFFSLVASFTQHARNIEILEIMKIKLCTPNKIHNNANQCKLVITFKDNCKSSEMLLNILDKHNPVNPGYYHDYLIVLLFMEIKKTNTLPLTGTLLSMYNAKSELEKKRSIMLTLLWLRFNRVAQTKDRKTLKTINDYYQHCLATQEEIAESEIFGAHLLKPIKLKVDQLILDLKQNQIDISKEFLSFYHVADGSFKCEVQLLTKENNRPVIQIVPCWQITDDHFSDPLLMRIKQQYAMSTMSRPTKENTIHLRANGWKQLEQVVIPFFRSVDLPSREFEKFKKVERLFELYKDPNTFKNYDLFLEYVEIAYCLNIDDGELGSNTRRTYAEFEKKYIPFIKKVFEFNNTNASS